jgi:hypothetical protein
VTSRQENRVQAFCIQISPIKCTRGIKGGGYAVILKLLNIKPFGRSTRKSVHVTDWGYYKMRQKWCNQLNMGAPYAVRRNISSSFSAIYHFSRNRQLATDGPIDLNTHWPKRHACFQPRKCILRLDSVRDNIKLVQLPENSKFSPGF